MDVSTNRRKSLVPALGFGVVVLLVVALVGLIGYRERWPALFRG